MRRPTGPAQRTPPARPERAAARGSEQAAATTPAPSSAPDEQLTEPIDLSARLVASRAGRAGAPAAKSTGAPKPESRKPAGQTAGGAASRAVEGVDDDGFVTRFESWRTVRRAQADRRKVERGEARRFTARTRRRRQIQLGCGVFVVLVLGGAVAAAYSPLMALTTIDVEGAHSVKAADVRQALAGELGKPLPLVRSSDIRHALDDFRLIQSYSTQLEPPSTLIVRITERTPLAVVKQGTSFELVDQAGVVLAAASTAQHGYPVVTLKAGEQPEASSGFAAAASVLANLPASVRGRVAAVAATSPNAVTLTLTDGKSVVWGGTDQTQLKTQVLQALLKGAPTARVYDVSSPDAPITR
ncbi:MAG: cell division protein FtsQ/DivIB [Microbacteriaceae bacterium]|nr:cell division protein FtsQ/DivIB [Microbacteriaceae bacterium]MCL2794948.1 cell division protein FtsQ/DivIB [Microbacteriaceae bacterium]